MFQKRRGEGRVVGIGICKKNFWVHCLGYLHEAAVLAECDPKRKPKLGFVKISVIEKPISKWGFAEIEKGLEPRPAARPARLLSN